MEDEPGQDERLVAVVEERGREAEEEGEGQEVEDERLVAVVEERGREAEEEGEGQEGQVVEDEEGEARYVYGGR